jgi:LEA14-like dessication related protein
VGVAGVLAASACSVVFQRPTVRVAEVHLASLGLSGGMLAVSLSIENPNRYALESQDFRYTVSFLESGAGADTSWVRLAEGRVAEPVKVPAHETGSVTLNVPFDVGAVRLAAGRLLRQGELEYRFTGELLFHTPLGGKRLPFDERGTFHP